jgi:protein SCO1/2
MRLWPFLVILVASLCGCDLSSSDLAGSRSALGPNALSEIGIDQHIGEQVPLDASFTDSRGHTAPLSEHMGDRPIVLALVYNRCPMLCNQVLQGLVSSLKVLELDAGEDFDVLAVSFDPKEPTSRAAESRAKFLRLYDRGGADQGVQFLTGEPPAIEALTEAVGFRYRYDPDIDQYAHAAALVVLTPGGEVARYFYGTEYSPRDMRLSLVEASEGEVGSVTDDLLLLCYQYDPQTGTYSAAAIGAIRIGGVLTLALVFGFVGVSLRRERRRRRAGAGDRSRPDEADSGKEDAS